MIKWSVLAATCILTMNAHAEAAYCAYKDYFRLSDDTHPEVHIVSGYTDQDVILQIIGQRSFVIRDSYQCRSGFAHVTVAYDNANWCVLDIKDGPMMLHPVVNASCSGLRYLNTEYDGFNSYSYTIHLD
ncbi:MAG: hypothetical protein BGO90_06755 [Legionella sp. 40-6]|nr:hypothetical protein [Legionella sp.]OJY42112.1 MAG: hypothetical protein BGO90_06755 [Legionella sp. 40-6]